MYNKIKVTADFLMIHIILHSFSFDPFNNLPFAVTKLYGSIPQKDSGAPNTPTNVICISMFYLSKSKLRRD